MANHISFGQIVKERRNSLGLTQSELARRAGCAPITIRKIESDTLRPSVQLAELLALALNVPANEQIAFVRLARQEQAPSPIPTPSPAPEEIGQPDLSGRSVRGFELGERIGSGGFGVVYRAVQPSVNRDVAVKIILPRFANHPTFIRRFEAEAHLVARLEHPHIVPLYDYWREPNAAYLIMRLLRGGNLAIPLQGGPIPLAAAQRMLTQIGLALHAAHKQGVVHRDVKPANILLDETQNAYLADFGIAKHLELNHDKTPGREEVYIGSPAYVSPEQIRSEPVRPSSDIYCFGLLLYEMLTGQKPFQGPTPVAYLQQQLNEPVPLLQEIVPDLPPALDLVVQQATAKAPEDRFQDMAVLLEALEPVLQTATADPQPIFVVETAVPLLSTQEIAALENPYRGLRAFGEADAANFFGREMLVQELLSKLSDGSDLERFLAVVGPSGSGKSSVVKAGLIPALRRGGLPDSENWFITDLTPGTNPWTETATALNRVATRPLNDMPTLLQADNRGLLRAVRHILPDDGQTELLLVIDQFEELFTLVEGEAVRIHFLESLVTAVLDPTSRLRVVITLRADFTDRPLQYIDFGELMQQRTAFVLPLTPDELTQAITWPVLNLGMEMEPELIATIIQDVGDQPGMLPLLQYALTELFDQRNGRMLTQSAYYTTGGVRGALARRADALYERLDAAGRDVTQQIFLRLVTLGEGVEDTRRRVQRSELAALDSERVGAVIDAYGRHRLLTFDHDPTTRGPTVEVAHEALLREWARLRGWLQDSRDDVRLQRLLATAAAEWLAAEHEEGFLLRGGRLDQFSNWAENTTIALTREEQAFLAASLAARQERHAFEEARRQRELETARQLAETERTRAEEQTLAAQRLRRRALFLVGALVVAALLAVVAIINGNQATQNANEAQDNLGLAVTREAEAQENAHLAETRQTEAVAEREAAQKQTDLATSRELALAALNNLEADPELSILLALQALHTSHTKEAEEALHQGMQASRIIKTLSGHTGEVSGVIYSPDGLHIATVGEDLTVRVWDTASGQIQHTLSFAGIDYKGTTLTFDESGNQVALVAVSEDFASLILHIWDVSSGELIKQKELPIPLENWSLALSPDWKRIFAVRENGTAELWDVEAAELLHIFSGHDDVIDGLAVNNDGSQLALTSSDGQVTIWDIESSLENVDSQPLTSFSAFNNGELSDAFFSNDGTNLILVIAGEGISLEQWDLTDTNQPLFTTLTGHIGPIFDVAFHPDDTMLATASTDGLVKVWDANSGEELFTLSGHKGIAIRVNFSPDGQHLITAGGDGTARIWNGQAQAGGELVTFAGGANAFDLKLSPDEQKIALGSYNGPATIWDAVTGQHLHTLPGVPGTVVGRVAFNPDGSHVAAVGADGMVRIWDAETGELLLTFTGHTEGVSGGFFIGTLDVSYSPDGRRLATAGADGLAKVWDAATGEELLTLAGHTAGLHSLAYSPDGNLIATSSDSPDTTVKVWDAQSGAEVFTLGPNPDRAWGLAFSPDSKLLGAGGTGGYISVWDLATGEVLTNMTGQTSTISTLAFMPDGQRLVSGSFESASIWDISTGTELVNLSPGANWEVALSADGRRLYAVTGSPEPGVRVLAVPLEDAVVLAKSKVTRSLSTEECRQYLHLESCPEQ